MQSAVMGCCCPSAPACCYSTVMCVVNNGLITNDLQTYQATGNATPAFLNGPACGSIGCKLSTLATQVQGIFITVIPAPSPVTSILATWELYSVRWNTLYDLCSILPPGSVHAGEFNRDPYWILRLKFSRSTTFGSFNFIATYRRLSETQPDFRCPSLGVYEYVFQASTVGGAFISSNSTVTIA